MPRRYLLFLFQLAICIGVSAASLSPQNAVEIGRKFILSGSSVRKAREYTGNLTVKYTAVSSTGKNCFYVIGGDSGNGYVMVSADDRLPEIIGYSDSGTFDHDNLPPNMKWWLDEYVRQIDAFLVSPYKYTSSRPEDMVPLSPALTTKWNQDAPYNMLCPIDPDTGEISVTGCVATAMAQVMKHYSHPLKAEGSRGDYSFSGTSFDWKNMLDSYNGTATEEQKKAVATLMLNCGMSVDMDYSSSSSGAQTFKTGNALTEHFGYDNSIRYNLRDYCSEREWEDMIYSDLKQGHVVLYHGRAPTGGHAFVCDGYGGNGFYHFNWGWGGSQDGYFRLFILNPSSGGIGSYDGGYNSSQGCFTGIRPLTDPNGKRQTLMVMTGYPKAASESGTHEWAISFETGTDTEGIFKNALSYTSSVQISFRISGKDGVSYSSVLTPFSAELKPNYGYKKLTLRLPDNLQDGEYDINIVYRDQSSEEWIDAKAPYGTPQKLLCCVSGGKISISSASDGNVTDLILNGIRFANQTTPSNKPFYAQAIVSNVGQTDFNGLLSIYLTSAIAPEKKIWSEDVFMRAPAGYSIHNEVESTFDTAPGNYLIHVTVDGRELMGSPLPLTLSEEQSEGIDASAQIRAIGVSPNIVDITDGARLSFTVIPTLADISAQSGKITMRLFRKGESSSIKSWSSKNTYTFTTAARNIRFSALDLSSLSPGKYEWQIYFTPTGSSSIAISERYPAEIYSVTSETLSEGQQMEFSLSSGEATVRAPKMSGYTGKVVIPEMVGSNKVVGLESDVFTFAAEVESLSLPSSVKEIDAAQFYCADALSSLDIRGNTPPVLSPYAFKEDAWKSVSVSVPYGCANIYKRTGGWDRFNFGHWNIVVSDGCRIVSGLSMASSGELYSPYYVSPEEEISFTIEPLESQTVVVSYTTSAGESGTFRDQTQIHLPALDGGTGNVLVSVEGGIGGVESVITDDGPIDVYGIDGTLVLKKATSSQIESLSPGIYIVGKRKFIIQ